MNNPRRLSLTLAVAAAFAASAGPARAQPTQHGRAAAADAQPTPVRAFLKLDLELERPARVLYVGQATPVAIRAYFLGGTGVTMNGRPTITSDSLVLSDLSAEPRQSSIDLRGLPYTVVTWTGVLTAVKEGAAKSDIELPVELSYREAARMPSQQDTQDDQPSQDSRDSDDPFAALLRQSPFASDPAFAQMFKGHDPFGGMFAELAGTIRRRDITLRDTAGALSVAALPPNPPPTFSGAVGTFDISATLGDEALRAGEPATLRLTVRGRGSFARLSVKGLAPSDDLNAYGVTPSFTPGPNTLQGEKVFTQTIAPRRAGELIVPEATLTYFDPSERRFVTKHTAPIRVSAAANASEGVQPSSPAAAATDLGGERRAPTSLVAAASAPDVTRTSLAPAIRTRSFWILAAAIALAAGILSIVGVMRRKGALTRVATSRRVRRAVAAERRSIRDAVARGDASALFAAGRTAFQVRLGATWGVPPDAIAAADVASRLGERGERIREVFERADRAAYSRGRAAPSEDLNQWQSLISEELGSLEVTSCRVSRSRQNRGPVTALLVAAVSFAAAGGVAAAGTVHAVPASYSAHALVAEADAELTAGHPGRAILAYERARLLAPRLPAVSAGLARARATANVPPSAPTLPGRALHLLSADVWAWAGMFGLMLAGGGVVGMSWSLRRRRGWLIFTLAGASVVCLGVVAACEVSPPPNRAVVVVSDALARIAPFAKAEESFAAPEGTEVSVEGTHDGYTLIATPSGGGWVPSSAVETILPPDVHRS